MHSALSAGSPSSALSSRQHRSSLGPRDAGRDPLSVVQTHDQASSHRASAMRAAGPSANVQRHPADAGQLALSGVLAARHLYPMAGILEIIGGPTPIQAPRVGDTYRWKVQDGSA